MNVHRSIAWLAAAVLLAGAASCTRPDGDIGLPTGPSTLSLTLDVEAIPNIILATGVRPTAIIRATVRKAGVPLADLPVYFTVLTGPGEFGDYSARTVALTDATGVAVVTYLGPTKDEINADSAATILIQPQTSTPHFLSKTIDISILKGQ